MGTKGARIFIRDKAKKVGKEKVGKEPPIKTE